MTQVSIISESSFTKDKRFDAEYFLPEYIKLDKILSNTSTDLLGNIMHVSDGNHLTVAEQYVGTGIRYLRGQDLSGFFIENRDPTFIPESFFDTLKRSHMKENDIVLSIVGTIGNVAIIKKQDTKLTGSCKLAILRSKSISSEYVYAFLLSKFGQFQIKRMIRGAVQKGLILPDIRLIKIAKPSESLEKLVSKMINDAHYKHVQAESQFKLAQNKILSFTEFQYDIPNEIAYQSNFNDALQSKRLDAEYYHPQYEKLLKHIIKSKSGYSKLVDSAPISKDQIDPSVKPNNLFTYVELSDINESLGVIDMQTKIYGKEAPSRARMLLKEGDVIASAVKGSFSKIAIVSGEHDNAVGSTGFFVFRPKEIPSEYILALIKSPIVQFQLEREAVGTILSSVPKESINKIIIPNISQDKQKIIANMVKESQQIQSEANNIIKNAINEIENYIE